MKTAFVFPGQGSQQVGMGRELHDNFPAVREIFDLAGETLGYDLKGLVFNGPKEELDHTVRTQPCLLTASIAALRALEQNGAKPDVVAGHSLGEYSALVAAEVFTFPDALRLTETRGKIMQQAVPEGTGLMAAVLGLTRDSVDAACKGVKSGYVAAANYNCPGQVVISGQKAAVEEAAEALKAAGAKRVVPLPVSVPSHCRLMDDASKKLSEFLFLGDIKMKTPKVPIVSNADAIFLSSIEGVKAALVNQINNPVLWENSIAEMASLGVDTFVEVGPGKVLSGLIKRIVPEGRILNVEDMKSLEATLSGLAEAR